MVNGSREQGTRIKFTGPEGGGTVAELVEVKPYERIFARHVAILLPGNVEDRESNVAKGWIGCTEEYRLNEHQGSTTLTVLINTTPEWRAMFDEGWPLAIQELKRVTELASR